MKVAAETDDGSGHRRDDRGAGAGHARSYTRRILGDEEAEGGEERAVPPERPAPPRLRRRPLGYKRADVDEALGARDAELAELRQETLRVGRASFERVVQLGIARGELADDVDVHLVADFARAPIIYRRVVAQVPVRVDEVEPIVDAVLAAFTAVPAVAMPERTNG